MIAAEHEPNVDGPSAATQTHERGLKPYGRGDEPLERHSPVRRRQMRAHPTRKCSPGRSDPPTQ